MPQATCPSCHHKGRIPPTFVEGQLMCPKCWTKFAVRVPRFRTLKRLVVAATILLLGAALLALLRGGSAPVQPDTKEEIAHNLARLGGWTDVSCWRFEPENEMYIVQASHKIGGRDYAFHLEHFQKRDAVDVFPTGRKAGAGGMSVWSAVLQSGRPPLKQRADANFRAHEGEARHLAEELAETLREAAQGVPHMRPR
jgi:hypothetical protein